MTDPDEGVASDGTIRTGARRDRVPGVFEDVLRDAVALVGEPGASLYLYGSVATGSARPGSSDVDLLSIDLPDAAVVGRRLSARYADRCRGVEVAAAASEELAGDTDAAYGLRVFLRHYCVHLTGPDPAAGLTAYPADGGPRSSPDSPARSRRCTGGSTESIPVTSGRPARARRRRSRRGRRGPLQQRDRALAG
ncbi:MAG: nucleotidyltransferase domain-containing protein [Cellulomonas sp.]|uniref:nucleotidyltransferase domain-containing protein n=1 Tax=Cellulomonas sp. TaxID=40001 RepID=UPI0019F92886|nr:nucleotidyltransferase domain-containing protein [Cellulomonas sp.]MBF0688146.1 nucleotidyltransferase domain-containing protein [Cellulomonas sp.]